MHAYTQKKSGKRYRYYVCRRAQKQGWQTCPTRSVSAPEIERFVVGRIRGIAGDPALVSETMHQAGARNGKNIGRPPLYGHRRFVCLIGGDEGHARTRLDTIKTKLESNGLLPEDFSEAVYPVRCPEGIANRCAGEYCCGPSAAP